MVTDPYVLLLDEPTSGLGATDTLVVTTALNSLTRTKRAVVAVVHQPRFQVFMLFHDLLLLYPGGRTVYFGPTHLAIVHFESIGFSPAHGVNPADFFLDVISGIVPKTGDESFHPSKLSLIWDKKVHMATDHGRDSYGSRLIRALSNISAAKTPRPGSSGDRGSCSSRSSLTPHGPALRLSSAHSPVGQRGATNRSSVLNWDSSQGDAMSRASSNAESARQLSRLLTSSTANPLLREVIQRLSTWFESADTSGDGTVQMEELEQVFLAMGIAETKQELKQKFEWMDVNGDRSVDHSEFLEAMMAQLKVMIKANAPTKDPSLAGEPEDQGSDSDEEMEEDEIYEQYPRRRRQDSLRRQQNVLPVRPMKHIWQQFKVLLLRALRQKLRSFEKMLLNSLTLVVCGMLVGRLLGPDHQPFVPTDTKLPFTMTMVLTVVGTLSAVTSLEVFGRDKVMFLRENSGGVSVTAYYTSKALLDMLDNLWQPFFFLGMCYILIVPRQSLVDMSLSLMFCSYAASGLGILVSICVSKESMTSMALLTGLVVGIFMNGMIAVTFNDVKANSSYGWVWSLSYSRWAGELLLVAELEAAYEDQYQLLLIEETIMEYGFFPPLETQSSWRESHVTVEEQQAAWATYFDDYTRTAYLWLMGIGLLQRLVALIVLAALPSIKSAIFVLNVSLQQFIYVVDISAPSRRLTRFRESILSFLSNDTSKADSTENSKNGIVDDDRLAAVRIEEDRPNVSDISLSTLQQQNSPDISPRSCHETPSSPDDKKDSASRHLQLKDIDISCM
ncbi:hypothetical protein CYMTET_53679 [Cymbomonas tetramitiformis]|uniref:EF-hand domain-containing protein n=1 Tax=Cymbomonas tetramitiformis TaxID=36881 RepID=A0AAE0BI91_9CHLO|nr:hypothetical protein CYMTET_53679 [Cymbomonas tetramitiformis]